VVSDWGAVWDPVAAVVAGLDLEMPTTSGASAARLAEAVKASRIEEAVLAGQLRACSGCWISRQPLPGRPATSTLPVTMPWPGGPPLNQPSC
jgi:hypothetical protein